MAPPPVPPRRFLVFSPVFGSMSEKSENAKNGNEKVYELCYSFQFHIGPTYDFDITMYYCMKILSNTIHRKLWNTKLYFLYLLHG